ncbi:MAG TPA: tetratricopeptide repeat protein [Flavobacterium sp.]|uniref:tetratricopeptide repeat protein n=1 Tax=Flavobacterium sp. TaxID=239 RepID=UPI002B4B8940|nr:tetratricopeptide repeat protein [Flavobacterium sp.]HLO72524.1 tetratricopeptide repeat protein [Flavobacterium sp.]
MKKLILSATLLLSVATFAQKDELKTLKKIYAKDVPSAEEIQTYRSTLTALENIATEESDKVYANFYKVMLPILELSSQGDASNSAQIAKLINAKNISILADGLNQTLDFEKKTGKKIYTDDINETIQSYKPMFWDFVVALDGQKKYNEVSEILYSIYQLDKKDQEKLYLAASYAINANNYDKAIEYHKELIAINYTGEGTLYYAKNKATGTEDAYSDKATRDSFVRIGSHNLPREEKIPSKRGDIFKTYAMLLVEKGKTEEAKTAITEARKVSPKDTSLILVEADLYLKLNDLITYKKLINEVLAINPNDADLVFNLGVVSQNSNQLEDAEKYYKKVLELNPNYVNAYLNLSTLKLSPDVKLVDEMNKLGTSANDIKKYNALKAERVKLFNAALPLLEKAYELDSTNESVKSNLLEVYSFLEMTDKYKALKAKK